MDGLNWNLLGNEKKKKKVVRPDIATRWFNLVTLSIRYTVRYDTLNTDNPHYGYSWRARARCPVRSYSIAST